MPDSHIKHEALLSCDEAYLSPDMTKLPSGNPRSYPLVGTIPFPSNPERVQLKPLTDLASIKENGFDAGLVDGSKATACVEIAAGEGTCRTIGNWKWGEGKNSRKLAFAVVWRYRLKGFDELDLILPSGRERFYAKRVGGVRGVRFLVSHLPEGTTIPAEIPGNPDESELKQPGHGAKVDHFHAYYDLFPGKTKPSIDSPTFDQYDGIGQGDFVLGAVGFDPFQCLPSGCCPEDNC